MNMYTYIHIQTHIHKKMQKIAMEIAGAAGRRAGAAQGRGGGAAAAQDRGGARWPHRGTGREGRGSRLCSQGAAATAKASSLTAWVAAATARWSRGVRRRRRRGGAVGSGEKWGIWSKLLSAPYIDKPLVPVGGTNRD